LLWSEWDVALGHYRRYNKQRLRVLFSQLPVEQVEVSYLFPEMLAVGLFRKFKAKLGFSNYSSEAEFPELPAWLNLTLYFMGRIPQAFRKFLPAGTSLLAVVKKTGQPPGGFEMAS
jgi:hypothetical protein